LGGLPSGGRLMGRGSGGLLLVVVVMMMMGVVGWRDGWWFERRGSAMGDGWMD